MLETKSVRDSIYNAGPLLPYSLGPPPLYVGPRPTDNAGPPPSASTLETNVVKDSIHNIRSPPGMAILEANLKKDSTPGMSILEASLRNDSFFNVGSDPTAAVASPDIQLSSSGTATSGRAPEPTPIDPGSSLPEVVDVEEEDLDDCLVVKIDLTNCQFQIGKRINNLELVIDDSDDEDNSGSTELNKATKAQKAKSKKKNNKDMSSTGQGNSAVKAKRKTKHLLSLSNAPGSENISDKSFTSVKSSSSSNDETESFCPLIMKVEDSYDLDEATAENEMPVLTDANDESSTDGVNPHTASSNPKGNEHVFTEPTEDGKSIAGGVSAENSKNIMCKTCSVTFPTRLELVNHMLLIHKPKQNQATLADESNKIDAPVIINLENDCHSEVVECKQEKLDDSIVNPHNATQSNREISLVHKQSHIQIISHDNPRLDDPVVYTDSAATEFSEGPINPATTSTATTATDNGATATTPAELVPLPPLCVRCELCCQWFSNYSRLMEHLRCEPQCKKYHDELYKKNYGILPLPSRPGAAGNKPNITCSSCKRKFATKAMLNRHLNDSPQCKKTSKKTGKSTAPKKMPEKNPTEEAKKKSSASESTANAKAVTSSKATTSVAKTNISTNIEIDTLTCKVCKTVFKDEILLAKHLQNSQVCLKPKETQEKKTNFQFRVQLSGYSNDGGLTQHTNDKVQALNRPSEQQEKNLEISKTKPTGQQVAPVTSLKPVLHQEPKAVISQPPKQRVEPVQLFQRSPFYSMTASGQQVAPVTSIKPAPYQEVITIPSKSPEQRMEPVQIQPTYFGFTAPGQQVSPVTSIKPVSYQEVITILPQPPEHRVEPAHVKQNETSFHTAASGQQGAPVTSIKPALQQEPKVIQWQPPEQRVEPVQIKLNKDFFFGAAPLFSDTDGSDSSSEENSGDSSSSNEDAVVEYKCKHCSNTFTHKSAFKKHLKSHTKGFTGHNAPKIHCKVCKKKFKDNTGLQAHLLQRRICFLHVTSAYHDSFEKGTNICQMCKKSLPSALDFSKHCYKSMTCRLRYIDLVLQNIKKAKGSSTSIAVSNFSGSLDEAKINTQASSSSLIENSSPGGVLAVVSSSQDKALLSNNIKPILSTMQDKIDLAVQSPSGPNTSESRRCHCCNAEYDQFVQHIITSKQCLIYYEMHPEVQPANNSFCFKCRRRFNNNLAYTKHFCIVYNHECLECGLRYLNIGNLKTHYRHKHPGIDLNAKAQPKMSSSSSATALESNGKETSSLTTFPLNCLICFAQFQTLILLMEHSYIHTEEFPIVCTRCNTTFHHYNRYVSHQAYHMRMDKDFGPPNQDSVLQNSGVANSAHPIVPGSGAPQLQIETGETAKESARKLGNDENKTNPYSCYLCQKTFTEFETYKTHVSLHSKVSYISCTVCFENFPSQKALKEHNKQHEISRTSNKNIKKTNANSPGDLKQNEKKTFTCLFCHLVFTDKKNKYDHLAQSVSCKSIMSYMLEKQFFVHPSTNQNIPFKPNQCVFCDEYFPDVVAHIIQTSCLILFEAGVIKYRSDSTLQNDNNLQQLNDYACDVCNKRFQVQSSLESHKLSVHKIARSKKSEDISKLDKVYREDDHLYCFKCKKYFTDANSVMEHSQLPHRLMSKKVMAAMSEKNGYAVCTLCNINFPLESNRRVILAHMYKVHNEGSSKLLDFCCKVDDAPVVDETSKLKYCCSICGAVLTSTARSGHVQMHIKNFISQVLVKSSKPLTAFSVEKCPICKHIVHSRKTMKLHLMRHKTHGIIKPLSEQKSAGGNGLKLCACPECKRWFKSEHSLNFHIKKCHSGVVEKSLKLSVKNSPAKKTDTSLKKTDTSLKKTDTSLKKTDTSQRRKNVEAADSAYTPKHSQAAELSTYICKLCPKRYTALSFFRSHLNKSHKILNLNNISDFMENRETPSKKETIDKNKTELNRTECLPGFTLKMTSYTCINCHICEASIIAQDYPYHLKSVHGFSVDQLYPCPHCSLKFPHQNLLSDHQYQCQLNCKCLICDKQTSTVSGFKRHLSLRHDVSLSSYTNAHFPCELIKVVNDGLQIVIADCKRSCLACGAMFTKQHEYRQHIESHVTECSVVLEDYFSMVQTENASHADDVPQESGLVNFDAGSMPTLEEVKMETQDCSGVQTTAATSDANINNDVVAVAEHGQELLNFLCSNNANMDSSTNVSETDMPNVQATEVHNEYNTLPIKAEGVSIIDLSCLEGDGIESSADANLGASDTVQSLGEVLEQRVQRKRSSSTELANEPKRRKSGETVSTPREEENDSQMSTNNFMHGSGHFDTDQFHMPSNNSMQSSENFDTDQFHMLSNSSMQSSEHFDTNPSQVQANNSVKSSDSVDTDRNVFSAFQDNFLF